MWIFSFLGSKLGKYAAIAGGVLLAALAIFRAGSRSAKRKQKVKNLEEYIDVNKRAREAEADAAREVGALDDDKLNRRLRDQHGALRDE